MGNRIGHDLQRDGVADGLRGVARVIERCDDLLAYDRHADRREQALGVVLVDGRPHATCLHRLDRASPAARRAWRRERLAPARKPIHRPEARARATDDRDPVLAQQRHDVAAEDARAHRHQIERLGRLPRALDEGLAVVQRARGRAHRLVVEAVGAERDRVVAGVASEHAKAVREVRPEVAVAPGVQRVAVAGDASHNALDLRARGGCQRRELQVRRTGKVEDQLRLPARRRHDREAPAARPALGLASRDHFRQLIHVGDLDGAMRAQDR